MEVMKMKKIKMDNIRKQVAEIEKAQKQIKKAMSKIYDIQNKNSYLRYLGENSTKHLDENECIELFELINTIIYADRDI
jgi:DNA-directed RNA polymerase subunit F